jgi:hypothetical protein
VTKLKCAVLIAAALRFHGVGLAKGEPIKISTITDASQPDSAEMMKLFRQKIAEHENSFKLVSLNDASAGLVFQADCLPRQAQDGPFVCFYTLHYAGATSKSLMGGGVNALKTADEMANGFLASVAQDILENMNNTMRTDAVQNLEACLFLTQSSCAVPELLVPELKVKTLNLSQYLQRGGLNKTKAGRPAQQK